MNAETRGRAEGLILMAFYEGVFTDSRTLDSAIELAHHAPGFKTKSLQHYQKYWLDLAAEIRRQFPQCRCRYCNPR